MLNEILRANYSNYVTNSAQDGKKRSKIKRVSSSSPPPFPLSTSPPAMLVHRIRPIRSTLIARHSTLRGWLSDQPRNDASQIHLRREQREIASMR